MARLTSENGFDWYRTPMHNKAIYDKLKYYEDLEEQGRLLICASKEQEIEKLKKMCLNCKFYTGGCEPCYKRTCHVYRRLQQLGQIK